MFKEALAFDDVLLAPQFSDIYSRADVELSTTFLGSLMDLPIISANMATVTESDMATAMYQLGGFGIIHRMNTPEEEAKIITETKGFLVNEIEPVIGFSFGVQKDWFQRVELCVSAGGNVACLDVAHADHALVQQIIKEYYRSPFWETPLIVGNVATVDGAAGIIGAGKLDEEVLSSFALKVGIGGGSLCSTRVQTGCGVPTFQSIYDIHRAFPTIQLIADGGIKNSGDVVKALAAGASAVMCGSLLAGTKETPGEILRQADGMLVKVYRGSASYADKVARGESPQHVEGAESFVAYKGSVQRVVEHLEDGIRSGFSYCGARNLKELHQKAVFVRITNAGYHESLPFGVL